jgi:hypothetical protein
MNFKISFPLIKDGGLHLSWRSVYKGVREIAVKVSEFVKPDVMTIRVPVYAVVIYWYLYYLVRAIFHLPGLKFGMFGELKIDVIFRSLNGWYKCTSRAFNLMMRAARRTHQWLNGQGDRCQMKDRMQMLRKMRFSWSGWWTIGDHQRGPVHLPIASIIIELSEVIREGWLMIR